MKKKLLALLVITTSFCFGQVKEIYPKDGSTVAPGLVIKWRFEQKPLAFCLYLADTEDALALADDDFDINGDGKITAADFEPIYPQDGDSVKVIYSNFDDKGLTKTKAIVLPDVKRFDKYCLFVPENIAVGRDYYWRLDHIYGDKIVRGEQMSFSVSHSGVSEDIFAVVDNPGMGWVLQDVYPIYEKDSSMELLKGKELPGVSNVAITAAWSDIEPQMDEYDFSRLNKVYDYWKAKGKDIHLRISTEPWGWWEKYGRGLGVPRYITDNMPQSSKQISDTYVGQDYVLVDARDPFYQDRLRFFLAKLNAHFSAAAGREVSLIDLRGFGVWGEWHSGYEYPTAEERISALKKIIDIWSESFPDNILALSYTHDPEGPTEYFQGPVTHLDEAYTDTYKDYLAYSAIDYALTKPNITFRRDGCAAVLRSNERKFAKEYITSSRSMPLISELAGGYKEFKYPADWNPFKNLKDAIDDCLSIYPNYITIVGWDGNRAYTFMNSRPDLVEYGIKNMGYRYVPVEIKFPQSITAVDTFSFNTKWVNRAKGISFEDFELILVFRDETNSLVSKFNLGSLNNRKWLIGNEYEANFTVPVAFAKEGTYKVFIEMRTFGNEKIKLPLDNYYHGGYFAGLLNVVK